MNFVIYCLWVALLKQIIENERQKKRYKGRDNEEEEVINYWITLRKTEATGTLNRKR